MTDELVLRVALRKGVNRDVAAQALTDAIKRMSGVELVTVDMNESGPAETTTSGMPGGLQLEETRRLWVRFGPGRDDRLHLARQQWSMLSMIMAWPETIRGSKNLIERLRAWDAFSRAHDWLEAKEGSATKIWSRLAQELDEIARARGLFASGLFRLTRKKGVYGWVNNVQPWERQ